MASISEDPKGLASEPPSIGADHERIGNDAVKWIHRGYVGCATLRPMSTVIARLIGYFFVGVLYAAGPLLLFVAIVSSIPKVEFVRNSTAAEGKIISLERGYSRQFSKETYKPVVRFVDGSGQTHFFTANSRAGFHPLKEGDSVRVLYLKEHPEIARIDTVAQLWMPQPLIALLGAALLVLAVRILIARKRQSAV